MNSLAWGLLCGKDLKPIDIFETEQLCTVFELIFFLFLLRELESLKEKVLCSQILHCSSATWEIIFAGCSDLE